jgi:phospholipid/cholesterol/gamma-HCH transport system ATP-binding protein
MRAAQPVAQTAAETVIEVQHVATHFGEHVVHTDVSFAVKRAEVFALVGGSGSGKSTLLRELILLQKPSAGTVKVLGADLAQINTAQANALRQRWGVVFQHGGLLGALNIKDNVALPLKEHTDLSPWLVSELAAWKLEMVGLAPEVAAQYPAQLSGGMLKRASLARALALDPELLFLDEPTAGLDPISAGGVDELVLSLRARLGLTVVMVTHDLDTLWQVVDRVAVLANGKVVAMGSMHELSQSSDPDVKAYFTGPRARAAAATNTKDEHGAHGEGVPPPEKTAEKKPEQEAEKAAETELEEPAAAATETGGPPSKAK